MMIPRQDHKTPQLLQRRFAMLRLYLLRSIIGGYSPLAAEIFSFEHGYQGVIHLFVGHFRSSRGSFLYDYYVPHPAVGVPDQRGLSPLPQDRRLHLGRPRKALKIPAFDDQGGQPGRL